MWKQLNLKNAIPSTTKFIEQFQKLQLIYQWIHDLYVLTLTFLDHEQGHAYF